jgi:tetratricopeptide (TPR) repeat protein
MPRRQTDDGGHTAFTDHRISAHPGKQDGSGPPDQIVAWRAPAPEFRTRNLALALLHAGAKDTSGPLINRSYELMLEAQKAFPADPTLLSGIGTALQARGEPLAAAKIFERVIELRPRDALAEENAGLARLEAGDTEAAARRLERALNLDPLLLPDIEALLKIYRASGDKAKEDALMTRVRQAMKTAPK